MCRTSEHKEALSLSLAKKNNQLSLLFVSEHLITVLLVETMCRLNSIKMS